MMRTVSDWTLQHLFDSMRKGTRTPKQTARCRYPSKKIHVLRIKDLRSQTKATATIYARFVAAKKVAADIKLRKIIQKPL